MSNNHLSPERRREDMKSNHQLRVEKFMSLAKQDFPNVPTIPTEEVRKLRAKLILEEALETIYALGFEVWSSNPGNDDAQNISKSAYLELVAEPNLEGIIDGCADLTVVTTGCAIACGVIMEPVLQEVDAANLRKFDVPPCPGCGKKLVREEDRTGCPDCGNWWHYTFFGHTRADGKWVKGTSFTPPNILKVLEAQGYEVSNG